MAPLARIKSSLTRMPVGVVAGALSARMSLVSLPMMRTAATAVLPKCCTSSSLPLSPPLPVHYPPYASPLCIGRRHYHTTPHSAPAQPSAPDARWLSDLLARLGRCIIFGCGPTQVDRAARVLSALATEWRGLVAGSEGFLTGGRGRRGLEGHQVAWGEQDSFQHVNNTNYIRWAESARVNWITHFAGVDPAHGVEWRDLMKPKNTGLIMKSIKADFKLPITYPDRISVYHKLRLKPEASHTSLILDCVILSHRHRRVAARTEEDVAIYDYRAGRKTTMPPFVLDVFRDTWRRQEEEIGRARGRIWELIREVEALEKETWDREDAVEDLGAADKKS